MNLHDIETLQEEVVKPLPNSYCFTKRLAEHLLVEHNNANKRIPLLIMRPSIFGAAFEEPVPGWTDSIGMVGGIIMAAGLGILHELPGNKNNIGDIIPVDFVVN